MTIASNFPAIKPSLMLDFANTKRLDPRVTFTRATTGTYYDGVTTAKAEQNLLTYSQGLNQWTVTNASVGTDTDTAPDGTSTAEAVKEDSATSWHRLQSANALGLNASTVYTMSVFVKQKTGSRYATIGFSSDGSNWCSATFDLSGGTNTQTLSSGYTSVSATITASVSSWYRVTLTATTNASSVTNGLAFLGLSATSTFSSASRGFDSYAGDNTSEILYWGAQLEQRSAVTAYTATTTQPITNYIPVLLTAASGVPRFDHNPTTDVSLGFLIEEQRTNELTYSEDFADASWTKTRSTIESNTIVAPDGTLTGDKLIDTTDNNTHIVSKSITTTAVARTFSVFAKQGGRSYLTMTITDSGNTARTTYFDLSTGAVGTTGTGITASIVNVGNGWYRCIVTIAIAYAGTNPHTLGTATADNTNSYAGNGYDGVFIWGAQAE